MSAVYAHLFTLASTVSRPHLRSTGKHSSPSAPAPMPVSATPHRWPLITTRASPGLALLLYERQISCDHVVHCPKVLALPVWRACSRSSAALSAAHISLRFWWACSVTSYISSGQISRVIYRICANKEVIDNLR
jgi:hypothetical protein